VSPAKRAVDSEKDRPAIRHPIDDEIRGVGRHEKFSPEGRQRRAAGAGPQTGNGALVRFSLSYPEQAKAAIRSHAGRCAGLPQAKGCRFERASASASGRAPPNRPWRPSSPREERCAGCAARITRSPRRPARTGRGRRARRQSCRSNPWPSRRATGQKIRRDCRAN
jgi:hypothetical protein